LSIYTDRLAYLRNLMADAGVDALLVSRPENRRYLSGHRTPDSESGTSAGWLLVDSERAQLLTHFIEYEQACLQAVEGIDVVCATGSHWAAAAEAIRGFRKVGFEASHLTYAAYQYLHEHAGDTVELAPAPALPERLRLVKDPDELAAICQAAKLTDQALAAALATIKPGTTEKEIAWRIEVWLRENGAGLAFPTIVASGPNAALPHAEASDRPISAGEPVIIDMGARWEGYNADLTRSFSLGHAEPRFTELWNLVLEAHNRGKAAMTAGATGRAADAAARDYLQAAGFGEAFGHSLGHGVGLAVHEGPRASSLSDDILAEGMVVTVEPGVYLPGWGGVRIEDLVVIKRDGVDTLSQSPKDLVIKGAMQ
jgi:Xaa-Pro aminopeptidase